MHVQRFSQSSGKGGWQRQKYDYIKGLIAFLRPHQTRKGLCATPPLDKTLHVWRLFPHMCDFAHEVTLVLSLSLLTVQASVTKETDYHLTEGHR